MDVFWWWVTCLNEYLLGKYNIEITYQIYGPDEWCVFLDVRYKWNGQKFLTDVYHKPTDAHRFYATLAHTQAMYSKGLYMARA